MAHLLYRRSRTAYLRRRYPAGGFVLSYGVRVFVDFDDPNYAWYDTNAPNLAFDQRLIRTILPQLDGNVFLDVGAHFGFFAAFMAGMVQRGETAMRTIALEPDDHHFRLLERTMAQFHGPDVTVLPFAAGAHDGRVELYESSDSSCKHTYADETTRLAYAVGSIRIDTLARRYLAPEDRIALIKIDVDGAEPAVLAGADAILGAHRPAIMAEFAPKLLRRSNNDPREYFLGLCDRWRVYWLGYDSESIRRIDATSYGAIEDATGEGISDLLLAPHELRFPGFRST